VPRSDELPGGTEVAPLIVGIVSDAPGAVRSGVRDAKARPVASASLAQEIDQQLPPRPDASIMAKCK